MMAEENEIEINVGDVDQEVINLLIVCGFTDATHRNRIITEGLTSIDQFTMLGIEGLEKMTNRLERQRWHIPFRWYQNLQALVYWACDKKCRGQEIDPTEFMEGVL